jgi:hypothetical protein
MELINSDRFDRCVECGAVIRPKDQCGRDNEDNLHCSACYETWLGELMAGGPLAEECPMSDEEMQWHEDHPYDPEKIPWESEEDKSQPLHVVR